MLKENFVQTIQDCIKNNWNGVALSDYKGKTYSYQEVGTEIARLHSLFKACSLQEGEKVSLIGKNSADWAIVYLAVITYGAVIVPILSDFKQEDIHNIVNHSDSVLFFCGDSMFDALDQAKMPALKAAFNLNASAVLLNRLGFTPDADKTFTGMFGPVYTLDQVQYRPVPNDKVAVISYTSGTTGFSKGVVLQHNSLMANIRFARNNMPLQPGDKIVSFLPLAHAYGCAFEFLFPFTIGCHITFLTKIPSPKILIQAFQEVRPRLVLSVPLVIEKIYKNQLLPQINKPVMKILLKIPLINKLIYKKIRVKLSQVFGGNFHEVVIGGAAFNQEAEDFFKKIKFPFTVGYGMTECGPLISYSSWTTTKLRSAGRPVDTLEVRIDSYDPYNIPGEILMKGDNVMVGYYKNPEATKAVIDENGWLHSGDLGVIDKDNNIFIRGRSKNMLLGPSGQNIYPEEIESRINNLNYIMESVVVQRNNKLVALVYPDADAMAKDQVSPEEWPNLVDESRKAMNREIPAFMNISEFIRHDQEFEKTPKRSIKRYLYS
ncbi:MAG: AMP-binding protein [Bacteroidales bacterium]